MAFLDDELSADRAQSLSAHLGQFPSALPKKKEKKLATEQRGWSRQLTVCSSSPLIRLNELLRRQRKNWHNARGGWGSLCWDSAVKRRRPTRRFAVEVAFRHCSGASVLAIEPPI